MNQKRASKPFKLFAPPDAIPILLCLVVFAASLLWISGAWQEGRTVYATVTAPGRDAQTIQLLPDAPAYDIALDGAFHVTLRVENGTIRFLHSDCRDQRCVETGALSRVGQAAACLPARIAVSIASGDHGIDAVTG